MSDEILYPLDSRSSLESRFELIGSEGSWPERIFCRHEEAAEFNFAFTESILLSLIMFPILGIEIAPNIDNTATTEIISSIV